MRNIKQTASDIIDLAFKAKNEVIEKLSYQRSRNDSAKKFTHKAKSEDFQGKLDKSVLQE